MEFINPCENFKCQKNPQEPNQSLSSAKIGWGVVSKAIYQILNDKNKKNDWISLKKQCDYAVK